MMEDFSIGGDDYGGGGYDDDALMPDSEPSNMMAESSEPTHLVEHQTEGIIFSNFRNKDESDAEIDTMSLV
jgi:hypothetical protein